jgi:hypothetical protein
MLEPPALAEIDESQWVVVKDNARTGVAHARDQLEPRGHGCDRHFVIPPGRLVSIGPDAVSLPAVDELD